MRSLEKITGAFKNGVKRAELERQRDNVGPTFPFISKDEPTGELTNFFEGNAYEELSKKIDAIPNPKGIIKRICYNLGYKLYENGLYLPKD